MIRHYNIIVYTLLLYNTICGQNINDPDYYPSQIDSTSDPIRRYLKLWSGILKNVAGDTEPSYSPSQNYMGNYQSNDYSNSYNDNNQRPFENLFSMLKNRISGGNLTPQPFRDNSIPVNQPQYNINQISNSLNSGQESLHLPNDKDKGIINEMLLHKLLPRNKGDMYAFTSTTPEPTTTEEVSTTTMKKKKKNKKYRKKTTTVKPTTTTSENIQSTTTSEEVESTTISKKISKNIGKDYKVKVKIGPVTKTTTVAVPTTENMDIEGSGEEIVSMKSEDNSKSTVSIEEESNEVEEIIDNEKNDISTEERSDVDILQETSRESPENVTQEMTTVKNNENNVEKIETEYSQEDSEEESDEEESTITPKKENTNTKEKIVEEEDSSEEEYEEVEDTTEGVPTEAFYVTTTELTTEPTTELTTESTTELTTEMTTTTKKIISEKKKISKNGKKGNINKIVTNKKEKEIKKKVKEPYTIPEAEEEEDFLLPKHSYASQIDAAPETLNDVTTTTKAPSAQAQSVYNFYTNANANSTPNNSNTVVPVSTMVDGMLPLLIPLLAARTPYMQNILDNLVHGVKIKNDAPTIQEDPSLLLMSSEGNKKSTNLLARVDKQLSNIINDVKTTNKNLMQQYISSVKPKQISGTNNNNHQAYYKTKISDVNENKDNIPSRPIYNNKQI
uniref:ShKT domain-containing protein n=1 Tax=Parastrongyloides trichosuri TaxID=131310 RepID=A0A0N4ZYB1_PARTI